MPDTDLDALLVVLTTHTPDAELRRRGETRNLFESVPKVRELARSGAMRAAAEAVLGPGCFAVRALLFDKTPDANWKIIWHQDLTIAVRERLPAEGFGPWSEKAGTVWRERTASVECLVPRGGLLVMRPLLLHTSSPATAPAHRRVLHLEYAAEPLPAGLEWHEHW